MKFRALSFSLLDARLIETPVLTMDCLRLSVSFSYGISAEFEMKYANRNGELCSLDTSSDLEIAVCNAITPIYIHINGSSDETDLLKGKK